MCVRCPLSERPGRRWWWATAPSTPTLMFVGEAPGYPRGPPGHPVRRPVGKLLTALLEGIGLRREDVFIANVLKCRPPGNRDPRPPRSGLRAAPVPPDRAHPAADGCTLGNFATKLLSGPPGRDLAASTATSCPSQVGGPPVLLYPLFHPAAALYTRAMLSTLEEDFARIPELLLGAEPPARTADAGRPGARAARPPARRGRARAAAGRAARPLLTGRRSATRAPGPGATGALGAGLAAHAASPATWCSCAASSGRARPPSCARRPARLGVEGPVTEPHVHGRPALRGRAAGGPRRRLPARRPGRRGGGARCGRHRRRRGGVRRVARRDPARPCPAPRLEVRTASTGAATGGWYCWPRRTRTSAPSLGQRDCRPSRSTPPPRARAWRWSGMTSPSPSSGSPPSRAPGRRVLEAAHGLLAVGRGERPATSTDIVVGVGPGGFTGPAHRPRDRAGTRPGARGPGDRRVVAGGHSRSASSPSAPAGALVVPVLDARRRELFAAAYRTGGGSGLREVLAPAAGDRARATSPPCSPALAGPPGSAATGVAAAGGALDGPGLDAAAPRRAPARVSGPPPWSRRVRAGAGLPGPAGLRPPARTPRSTGGPPPPGPAPDAPAPAGRPAEPVTRVRPMRASDVPQVVAIEAASSATPWTRAMFLSELGRPVRSTWLRSQSGDVLGYVMVSRYADVWHILNVWCVQAHRDQGIGGRLLRRAFARAAGQAQPAASRSRSASPTRAAIRLYRRKGSSTTASAPATTPTTARTR